MQALPLSRGTDKRASTTMAAVHIHLMLARLVLWSALTSTAGDLISSLRHMLREKETALRVLPPVNAPDELARRRLNGAPTSFLCNSGPCRVELTTGVARWVGAAVTSVQPHWAHIIDGSWIGISSQAPPSFLVASVSFEITEPACAAFDLAFAADGRVLSAELNGRPIAVPDHGYRQTTADAGTQGLVAERGASLFTTGTNSLLLSISRDSGTIGLYVRGAVQLLCPLDEATISMDPASGPVAGATSVTLRSTVHLYSDGWIRCYMQDHSVDAVIIDTNTVRCVTPSVSRHPRGWADLEIVTSHQGNSAVGFRYQGQQLPGSFYYHGVLTVSNLVPTLGPTHGGTSVMLHGRFDRLGTLRCRFGDRAAALTMPRVIDAFQIECTSTPRADAGVSVVQVTGNGQQYSHSRISFAYHDPLTLVSLFPGKIKSEGGTMLTLRANSNWPRVSGANSFCRIGPFMTPASVIVDATVACAAPAHHPGFVVVELTANGQDYTAAGKQVQYVQIALLSVHPVSGPRHGATMVELTGVHLLDGLACTFDGQRALASRAQGREQLFCRTPAVLQHGWVVVQLIEGNRTIASASMFHVDEEVSIRSVAPWLGPEAGGTRVAVVGVGFRDAYTLRCRFQDGATRARSVDARYMHQGMLECITPARVAGVANLAISLNGQQYAAGGARYTYQPAAAVSHVAPSAALSEGGTPLTVHGGGFSAASEALGLLFCRLGHILLRASFASTTAITCFTPRLPSGFAAVQVSNNARDFVGGISPCFLELVALLVVDAHPFSGPTDGQTAVTVVGSGFQLTGLACRFGGGSRSLANRLSPYRIVCTAPSYPVTGWVTLELQSHSGTADSASAFYYRPSLAGGEFATMSGADGADTPLGSNGASSAIGARIAPDLGPTRGGTIISVTGRRTVPASFGSC